MKKEKLFLRHIWPKQNQRPLDPANPRIPKQAGDIPKQTDCAQKGPTI